MDRKRFEEIYEKYGERRYPEETTRSVQRCHIPYEKKDQAVKEATGVRKLAKQDAMNDVADFFHCLKRCYSGYDYFFTEESCKHMQNSVIEEIKHWPGKISNRRLCKILQKVLNEVLNDSHFELYVCLRTRFFQKRYLAYVTELILRKTDSGYEVVRGNTVFCKGHFFSTSEVQEFLMPTLFVGEGSNPEEKYYLLGKYSLTRVTSLSIGRKKIKTHRILSDLAKQTDGDRIIHKKGYFIVNHATYGMSWKESLLEEYERDGCTCAKGNAVILNLLGNGGGCSDYPERFYRGLCGTGENWFAGAYLPSPENVRDEVKRYTYAYPSSKVQPEYEGKVYVVMNKATASSAEMGISPSYHLKNAFRVGSASFGCSTFGNCVLFQLPNSKIVFRFGHRLSYHEGFEEGKGFLPDFWIDDKNPVGVVEQYLKETRQI